MFCRSFCVDVKCPAGFIAITELYLHNPLQFHLSPADSAAHQEKVCSEVLLQGSLQQDVEGVCFERWSQRSGTRVKGRTGNIRSTEGCVHVFDGDLWGRLHLMALFMFFSHHRMSTSIFRRCILSVAFFILPLTSSIDPVRRLDDDIQGKQLDSQAAHHYLFCPIDNKWLCCTGNYQRKPRRPSKRRTWRLPGPVSNKYWLNNTTIFVYVSRVCDWLSAE